MERVRGKLHSRTGASMLIALLFFLVAMTVGAVVLTAASANAGRVTRNRQEQQNYLAVASAAELVKEDIAGAPGAAFTASYDKVVTEYSETWTDDEGNSHTSYKTVTTYQTKEPKIEESRLLPEMRNLLKSIYFTTVPAETGLRKDWVPGADVKRKLSFDAVVAGKELPDVTGTITVVKDETDAKNRGRYTLLMTLADAEGKNAMTMIFPAKVKKAISSQGGNPVITTYTTTVTWEAPVIMKGAGA